MIKNVDLRGGGDHMYIYIYIYIYIHSSTNLLPDPLEAGDALLLRAAGDVRRDLLPPHHTMYYNTVT